MCGIYASFSSDAGKKVFEGLKRIEYRGYDSWGIATLENESDHSLEDTTILSENKRSKDKISTQSSKKLPKIKIKKDIGKLSDLDTNKVSFSNVNLALGHTRWATHGGVTKLNAHPHLAKNKSFALVQNGVVENYQELKSELLDDNYSFISETDTEVIVGLLEKEIEKSESEASKISTLTIKPATKQLTQEIFIKVFKRLTGRNTVVVMTLDGKIMAIRNGSPLVVGKGKDNSFTFSSDVTSMSLNSDEYISIKSGQMVVLDSLVKSSIFIINIESGKQVDFKFSPIPADQKLKESGKDGFESFMLKEIHEQSRVLSNIIPGQEEKFDQAREMIKNADQVFTLACGSASFATGNTAYLLRKNGFRASEIEAYEADSYLNLLDNIIEKDILSQEFTSKYSQKDFKNSSNICIVFSQSGETADTNEVVEQMKKRGVKIISVVNMPGSTLTELSDLSFMLGVGPELAVASTKAFFGHVLWGIVISKILFNVKINDVKLEILDFEHKISIWLNDKIIQDRIHKIAEDLTKHDHLFVLGRGDLYYANLESALKLKEISYIHAEGFSGGELKHGVIALIEKGTPVLCLVAEDENKANMINAIAEVRARGGRTIVVAQKNNDLYNDWIEIPAVGSYVFLASVLPSQLLTCYMAMIKGFNVDKPRNLAKSVTVK